MPVIKVLYWNIENFGVMTGDYNANYQARIEFITRVVQLAGADVLYIQELKSNAIRAMVLQQLQASLMTLPAPMNNWYYDWIMGSIGATGVAPYATAADTQWDRGHYEGYAVFWNQNISKFAVTLPPPVVAGVANTQSQTVRGYGQLPVGGGVVPLWGMAVPAGGQTVPAGANPYITPTGTTAPAGAAIPLPLNIAGGAAVLAPTPTAAGQSFPAGTLIGPGGIQLSVPWLNFYPVVIPGNYTLTETTVLPAAASVLVPEYALSLVMQGRDTIFPPAVTPSTAIGNIGAVPPFAPGAAYNWQDLYFSRGAGFPASPKLARRPAFLTLNVNRGIAGLGPAARLVPLVAYHAPAAAVAANTGMQRASFSRILYQAYDHGAGAWIDSNFAVLGGDNNTPMTALPPAALPYPYANLTNAFAAGGANCAVRVSAAPLLNPANDTVISLDAPFGGGPIFSPLPAGYRNQPIDNIFYRGFTAAQAPVPAGIGVVGDLLPAMLAAAPVANPNIFLNLPVLNQAAQFFAGVAAVLPATPNINNPLSTVQCLFNSNFNFIAPAGNDTPARRAAEMYRLCISDHLPVVFQMNL